jgi:small GTP-binding protein
MSEVNGKSYTIMTLGESTVGKTSYIEKYVDNKFKNSLPTIGYNIYSKYFYLSNGEKTKIIFEDTSGQERYHSLAFNIIKKVHGIILMYDITKKETFDTIRKWWKNILDHKDKDFPIILVGNKCDLEDKRQVQKEEGENIAKELGIKFIETSNKNGINIKESVRELINMILRSSNEIEDIKSVKLDKKKLKKRKKKKCCK